MFKKFYIFILSMIAKVSLSIYNFCNARLPKPKVKKVVQQSTSKLDLNTLFHNYEPEEIPDEIDYKKIHEHLLMLRALRETHGVIVKNNCPNKSIDEDLLIQKVIYKND